MGSFISLVSVMVFLYLDYDSYIQEINISVIVKFKHIQIAVTNLNQHLGIIIS